MLSYALFFLVLDLGCKDWDGREGWDDGRWGLHHRVPIGQHQSEEEGGLQPSFGTLLQILHRGNQIQNLLQASSWTHTGRKKRYLWKNAWLLYFVDKITPLGMNHLYYGIIHIAPYVRSSRNSHSQPTEKINLLFVINVRKNYEICHYWQSTKIGLHERERFCNIGLTQFIVLSFLI